MNNLESFITLRNTDRIQRTIEKMELGQPVSLVLLGGSVTFGLYTKRKSCFYSLIKNWLQETYPNSSISVHNLAVSGSPSIFGLYESIRFAKYYKPDLIFLEYAINDTKNWEHQAAFESMLSYCLSLPKNPGVVLLLAKSNAGYTCENYMDIVAEHYKQSSIFISHATNLIPWEQYSNDYGHPNDSGHKYIYDLVATFFKMAASAPLRQEPLPKDAFFNNDLQHLTFLNRCWNYCADGKNSFFTITLNCRYLYLLYLVGIYEELGNAELWIDGNNVTVFSGYRIDSWDHLVGHIVELSEEKTSHTIRLQIQKGDENKFFSLQNIGYC